MVPCFSFKKSTHFFKNIEKSSVGSVIELNRIELKSRTRKKTMMTHLLIFSAYGKKMIKKCVCSSKNEKKLNGSSQIIKSMMSSIKSEKAKESKYKK